MRRGRIPLLVGGTLLYLRALLHGLAPLPQASPRLRARDRCERAAREGWPALHAELGSWIPPPPRASHANDAQRIQRALEVCHTSGRAISRAAARARISALAAYRAAPLGPRPGERAVLHAQLARAFQRHDGAWLSGRGRRPVPPRRLGPPAIRPCAPWATGSCGRTSPVRSLSPKQSSAASRRRASWPNVNSRGCASDETLERRESASHPRAFERLEPMQLACRVVQAWPLIGGAC